MRPENRFPCREWVQRPDHFMKKDNTLPFLPGLLTVFLLLFALALPQGAMADHTRTPKVPDMINTRKGLSRDVFPLTHVTEELFLQRIASATKKPKGYILMLHGLTWSSHVFDLDYLDYSLANYLAHQGYAVWVLDHAGYGQSNIVGDGYQVDTFHAVQEALLAINLILVQEKCLKVDLLGMNWGSVVAGVVAAEHPDKVNRLILYSPILVGLGESMVDNPFFFPSWQVAADEFQHDPTGAIDQDIHDMAAVNTFIANCWRYEKEMTPNGGRRDLHVSKEIKLIPVEKIKAPTLLIYGETDNYVDAEAVADAMDVLPKGSKTVSFPDSYIFPHIELPHYKSFRENILAFLHGE